MTGECLYVWEYSSGCENNKAAEKEKKKGAEERTPNDDASGVYLWRRAR